MRAAVALIVLFLFSAEAWAQYGGPSVLSRGGNRPGRRGRAPLNFNFYAGVRGTLDQGLIAPQLTEEGTLDPVTAYGWSAEAGLYGSHAWRRSSLGVDYRGDYRYNTRFKLFNGFNQVISLDYQNQISRRTAFYLRQSGGTSNRAFGGFAAPAFGNSGQFGIPLNEVYDVRTYFSQTSGAVGHRLSARLTVGAQGAAFFVKRKNLELINSQGYSASAFTEYRLSARTQVGASYQFTRFDYPRMYTTADANSVSLNIARQLTRNWQVEGSGGVYRIDATGTEVVELSPEVAFILGTSRGVRAFTRTLYRPQIHLGATYVQDRGRFNASYNSMVGGGNGVFMATQMHVLQAGYSYAGLRRASLGISGGYTRSESLTIQLGNLEHYQGGVGGSYRLMEHLHFSGQLDYRVFNSPGLRGREGFALSIGLSYTPSRFPIPIW